MFAISAKTLEREELSREDEMSSDVEAAELVGSENTASSADMSCTREVSVGKIESISFDGLLALS